MVRVALFVLLVLVVRLGVRVIFPTSEDDPRAEDYACEDYEEDDMDCDYASTRRGIGHSTDRMRRSAEGCGGSRRGAEGCGGV